MCYNFCNHLSFFFFWTFLKLFLLFYSVFHSSLPIKCTGSPFQNPVIFPKPSEKQGVGRLKEDFIMDGRP